jgi:hypothetical protein
LLAGQTPYLWVWRNIIVNLNQGRSAFFGTEPPFWLLGKMMSTWWIAGIAVGPLALLGARRLPILALVACVVLVEHSLIPHKEYRFVLLASSTLVLLAAIGSVDGLDWLANRRGWLRKHLVGVACASWLGLAVTVGIGPGFIENWDSEKIDFTTLALAGNEPGLCGLATYQLPYHPVLSYAFVNRSVQMLMLDGPEAALQAAANRSRFNVVLASRIDGASLPNEYQLRTCYDQTDSEITDQFMCLFVRPGGCAQGTGDFDYQQALQRRGY